jgi:hypothetical protein
MAQRTRTVRHTAPTLCCLQHAAVLQSSHVNSHKRVARPQPLSLKGSPRTRATKTKNSCKSHPTQKQLPHTRMIHIKLLRLHTQQLPPEAQEPAKTAVAACQYHFTTPAFHWHYGRSSCQQTSRFTLMHSSSRQLTHGCLSCCASGCCCCCSLIPPPSGSTGAEKLALPAGGVENVG